ncbi:MAG: hypothetical protein J0M07_23180 [Anaerolineae bacterium]|jgi:hypothetical protein|uniref:hypothetical protein n=1 Tax=Candidatus Flexifilum breve TaxID=3140694 RepID=UPI001AC1EC95|nr:hypothetical protein [Chloroflexota bacterium]MBK9745535.1 hypothetical protein [Chloroflexota bacterium]MBN8638234.1 hypothetical protein [Anaerolineae bacterium]
MESLNELPPKKLQELELLTSQLLNAMKRTGLERETVYADLTQLHSELGRIRRERFDSDNPNFTQHSA